MPSISTGQISAELMTTISVMVFLLVAIYMVNNSLSSSWNLQMESLQASSASNQLALAINKAAVGGNGTQIRFKNSVGESVISLSIQKPRAVKATTRSGISFSTPIITNNTNISGEIPLNSEIFVLNRNGQITIRTE